jgi:hypothetical protein
MGGTAVLDLHDVRPAAGAMLAAAFVLPALPGHPGVPCPLRTLTGIPCPLCGMTTSVEDTVHAHLVHAFAANPAGLPLVACAVAAFGVRRPRLAFPAVLLYAAFGLMWLFELHRFALL